MKGVMDRARRIVEIRLERRAIAARDRALREEFDELAEGMLMDLADLGLKHLSMDEATIYPSRRIFASAATSPEALTRALSEAGLEEFTTYSPQRLTAYVRERTDGLDPLLTSEEKLRQALPPEVAPHVRLEERPSVNVRLNGAKEVYDE